MSAAAAAPVDAGAGNNDYKYFTEATTHLLKANDHFNRAKTLFTAFKTKYPDLAAVTIPTEELTQLESLESAIPDFRMYQIPTGNLYQRRMMKAAEQARMDEALFLASQQGSLDYSWPAPGSSFGSPDRNYAAYFLDSSFDSPGPAPRQSPPRPAFRTTTPPRSQMPEPAQRYFNFPENGSFRSMIGGGYFDPTISLTENARDLLLDESYHEDPVRRAPYCPSLNESTMSSNLPEFPSLHYEVNNLSAMMSELSDDDGLDQVLAGGPRPEPSPYDSFNRPPRVRRPKPQMVVGCDPCGAQQVRPLSQQGGAAQAAFVAARSPPQAQQVRPLSQEIAAAEAAIRAAQLSQSRQQSPQSSLSNYASRSFGSSYGRGLDQSSLPQFNESLSPGRNNNSGYSGPGLDQTSMPQFYESISSGRSNNSGYSGLGLGQTSMPAFYDSLSSGRSNNSGYSGPGLDQTSMPAFYDSLSSGRSNNSRPGLDQTSMPAFYDSLSSGRSNNSGYSGPGLDQTSMPAFYDSLSSGRSNNSGYSGPGLDQTSMPAFYDSPASQASSGRSSSPPYYDACTSFQSSNSSNYQSF